MSDGKSSGKIGGFSPDQSFSFEGKDIGKIEMKKRRADENQINYIMFWDKKGNELLIIEGHSDETDNADSKVIELDKNEKIVGMVGHHDKKVVYGLQFKIAKTDGKSDDIEGMGSNCIDFISNLNTRLLK